VQNESAFLYRLGSNLMLDRLRQQRRSAARDGDWRGINVSLVGGEEVADEPGAEETVTGRQRLAQVIEALKTMPPQHRDAFRMHRLEGMSQAQTAAALGVSVSSVEKYVRAALTHILGVLR